MVPVFDQNKIPLMPCSEKRARQMMEKGKAKPYWQKGIFCVKLTKKSSDRKYQEVVLGVDPGSKREGYTVITQKKVVLNIITDTPSWIKRKIKIRSMLRRSRRQRKTPYRKQRLNRSASKQKGRIPPSTKARWDAKLRIIKLLLKILPISIINIEDFSSRNFKGKQPVNQVIAIMQNGKNYFYNEIKKLNIKLIKTQGFETYKYRKTRGFSKLTAKYKLDYKWEAHNSDSHCLAEIALKKEIKPFKGLIKINFINFYRRQLHYQSPFKNNKRKKFGGTISMNMNRGSVLRYIGKNKIYYNKLYYLGGTSNNKISICDISTGKVVNQYINISDIKIMYNNKKRIQYLK